MTRMIRPSSTSGAPIEAPIALNLPTPTTLYLINRCLLIEAIPINNRWLICETDLDAEVSRLSISSWYSLAAASRAYAFHADCDVDTIDFGPWTALAAEAA